MSTMRTQTEQIARLLEHIEGSLVIDEFRPIVSEDPKPRSLTRCDTDESGGWSHRYSDLEALAFVHGALAAQQHGMLVPG